MSKPSFSGSSFLIHKLPVIIVVQVLVLGAIVPGGEESSGRTQ